MENETTVPSAEASAPEPMTFDSALAQLNAADEPQTQEQPTQETTEEPAGDEVEDATQADAPEPEADADPEPTDEPEEAYAHGNTRTRLRDGTVTTVGELKKAAEKARDLETQLQGVTAKERELQQQMSQISQQQALISQAKAVLESRLPPKPDLDLARNDPIEYGIKKAEYDAAVEQYQQLEQAERANRAEAVKKQQEAQRTHMAKQGELLREKRPEFKDPAKAEAFWKDLTTVAVSDYDFKVEELQNAVDYRVMMVMQDAMAYRKLMAAKPKADAKVKDAPPVATPGRRVSTAEKTSQAAEQGMQRLRKTGSFNDALNLLNSLES